MSRKRKNGVGSNRSEDSAVFAVMKEITKSTISSRADYMRGIVQGTLAGFATAFLFTKLIEPFKRKPLALR